MKNNKKALIAAAGALLIGVASAGAYTTSFYTGTSALSKGHIVKVAADTTGIYEISYDRLRELGFSDPSKVRVLG